MNEQNQRDSIMSMARGAFEERVDYEMDKVIQNILDPNTKATAKRKITLTIELTPDDERRTIGVSVTAKSTLAATNPVATALYVTSDGNGELVTFLEVEQPESEFLLRVDPDEGIGFFEADGGIWKLEAKKNIADYFLKNMGDLIDAGKVVVMQ